MGALPGRGGTHVPKASQGAWGSDGSGSLGSKGGNADQSGRNGLRTGLVGIASALSIIVTLWHFLLNQGSSTSRSGGG